MGNSPSNPIQELGIDDDDNERSWVTLGARVPELKIIDIQLSDTHISPSSEIEISVSIVNSASATDLPFNVAFYAGDDSEPFKIKTINGLSNDSIDISVIWEAEDNVDRIRVVIDPENVIVEVNKDNNQAEHSVEVVYETGFGWLDSPRENPLVWVFVFVSMIAISTVFFISRRTALEPIGGSLFDDDTFDDDYDEEDDEEEDDEWT